nr:hypothetical protein [Granulicella sp. S190]
MHSSEGRHGSQTATDKREEDALRQKLANEPLLWTPQRQTGAEFGAPRAPERKQQACDIGTDDKKDNTDCGKNQLEWPACVSVHLLFQDTT